jgi:hypothetical protein
MSYTHYFCVAGHFRTIELLNHKLQLVTLLIEYLLNFLFMIVYTCKKCGEPNYLIPHAFWNITDFGAKCEKCETINTITLANGELKKRASLSQLP